MKFSKITLAVKLIISADCLSLILSSVSFRWTVPITHDGILRLWGLSEDGDRLSFIHMLGEGPTCHESTFFQTLLVNSLMHKYLCVDISYHIMYCTVQCKIQNCT
jgi:hypothetical protein